MLLLDFDMTAQNPKNVLGTELQACCFEPKTGYYRDGYCKTGADDIGTSGFALL